MNGRERVLTTLAHHEGDHIPIYDSFWQDTLIRWRQEGLSADIELGELLDEGLGARIGIGPVPVPDKVADDGGRKRYADGDRGPPGIDGRRGMDEPLQDSEDHEIYCRPNRADDDKLGKASKFFLVVLNECFEFGYHVCWLVCWLVG